MECGETPDHVHVGGKAVALNGRVWRMTPSIQKFYLAFDLEGRGAVTPFEFELGDPEPGMRSFKRPCVCSAGMSTPSGHYAVECERNPSPRKMIVAEEAPIVPLSARLPRVHPTKAPPLRCRAEHIDWSIMVDVWDGQLYDTPSLHAAVPAESPPVLELVAT